VNNSIYCFGYVEIGKGDVMKDQSGYEILEDGFEEAVDKAYDILWELRYSPEEEKKFKNNPFYERGCDWNDEMAEKLDAMIRCIDKELGR